MGTKTDGTLSPELGYWVSHPVIVVDVCFWRRTGWR